MLDHDHWLLRGSTFWFSRYSSIAVFSLHVIHFKLGHFITVSTDFSLLHKSSRILTDHRTKVTLWLDEGRGSFVRSRRQSVVRRYLLT